MSAPATRPCSGPSSGQPSFGEPGTPSPMTGGAQAKLIECLGLLWGERRKVGRWMVVGLLAATLIAFVLPKQYQSSAQLMPPDNGQSGSSAMLAALSARTGGGIASMAGDLLGGNSTGALFLGILRSRTLEDRLVKRFGLKRVYGVKLEEEARTKLANNTGISEDHKSGIISISVVDHDPARARAIAQAYMEELERLVSELSTSAARRERLFLEGRRQAVKQELDLAAEQFSQFASQNTAINIPEQAKAMVEAAAALQGQLIAAQSELKGLSEIYTANNVRVRSVEARVLELRHQLEKLDGDSGPARTEMRQTDRASPVVSKTDGAKNIVSKMDESQSKGSQDDASPSDGSPSDGSPSGLRRIEALGGPLAYPTIRELPLLGVTYSDLMRRTKIQEAVYETLTQQYELAKVQEAKETPSVKVLDAASLPETKVFPPRLLIMFWGALLGLAAAAFRVVGAVHWRQLDYRNPAKLLAHEVFLSLNTIMPWAPPNGSRVHGLVHRIWMRFAHQSLPLEIDLAEIRPSAVGDSAHDAWE